MSFARRGFVSRQPARFDPVLCDPTSRSATSLPVPTRGGYKLCPFLWSHRAPPAPQRSPGRGVRRPGGFGCCNRAVARGRTPTIMHRTGELDGEPTPAEAKLWAYLRRSKVLGIGFRRQHAIGRYIVDFCSPSQKLVIELDGSQHLEQKDADAERTRYLETKGYTVLRFWNDKVLNDIGGVIRAIEMAVDEA
jgi:very-short-patch-repair endonuclease